MTQQDQYRQFAASAPDMPLFLQPWYLDAVCTDGVWDAVLVEKGGRVAAVLPFFVKKKWGWRYVAMPRLCKFLGPYLLPEWRHVNEEMRLYEALLEALPKDLGVFQQDMNYAVTNWLPFYWRGFQQTTRYSYTLSLAPPVADLFQQISKNYRQKIKTAAAALEVRYDRPLADLQRLIDLSFARQGLGPPLDPAFFERVYAALQEHHSCQLFFAVSPADGALHSAALLAWDTQAAYYLVSGDDPALRQSGSALLLKWEAIQYAKNVLQLPIFDFEGSMIRAIEMGRRDFGAQQQPYFRIWKSWKWIWKLREKWG
jgi:hypothetical protein